jgi:hypothetical protein
MFKFNNGNGAIICDFCRIIIVAPAAQGDEIYTPFFTPAGEAYCSIYCAQLGSAPEPDPDFKMIEPTRCEKCNDALDRCKECCDLHGYTRMQHLCSKHAAAMKAPNQCVLDNDECDLCE